jgi:adenylate kinase family enzyme
VESPARRIWVVGNSGSGKSTFARRLAAARGLTYVELDALNHLPNWQERSPEDLAAEVSTALDRAPDGWVADGNYRNKIGNTILDQADTIVWMDLPRPVVMRAVTRRTIRRAVRREELWNGNREQLRNVLSYKPDRSIIVWAWTSHAKYRERYATLAAETPELYWLHLQSRAEMDAALHTLARSPH